MQQACSWKWLGGEGGCLQSLLHSISGLAERNSPLSGRRVAITTASSTNAAIDLENILGFDGPNLDEACAMAERKEKAADLYPATYLQVIREELVNQPETSE